MLSDLHGDDLAQFNLLLTLGRAALAGHVCPAGPAYMRVEHPNGEDYTLFDDPAVHQSAIDQGRIDPAWNHEFVVLSPGNDADRARAIAWHYIVTGLDVPEHVRAAAAARGCGC